MGRSRALLLIAPLLIACGSPVIAPAAQGQGNEDLSSISCTVSYRGSPRAQGREESLTVPAEQDSQIHADKARFAEMRAKITYFDDGFESPVFNVVVKSVGKKEDIEARLYQFERTSDQQGAPARRPANEFVGGHGFTGLGYVFDPDSRAEIQYFCTAE